MRKKIIYGVLAVVILIGGFFGWRYAKYLSSHIETDDAQIEGNIVPVLARVGGFISKLYVVENQFVNAGQVLAELDSLDLAIKLEESQAAYQTALGHTLVARSHVEDSRLAQGLAQTSIEAPRTNLWKARNEFVRYNELNEQKLTTPQKLDEIKAALETAQAQFDMANQRAESSKVQYGSALNELKVAEATAQLRKKEIDMARLQLSYTKIIAPVSGLVSKKSVQTGQLLQPGQPLMSIVQDHEIWVTANYKETQLEGLHLNNPVIVKVDAYPNLEFKGKVQSVGGATGAKFSLIPPDNASGNFVKVVQRISIRISLDSTAEVALLKPGMSVQSSISISGI